jgi:hypothetical protein
MLRPVSCTLLLCAIVAEAAAGDASYCVFSRLTPGVPSYVDVYRIDEQPCVVTQHDQRTVRLETDAVRKNRGPISCSGQANCTARNEYYLPDESKPFVVIFRGPRA